MWKMLHNYIINLPCYPEELTGAVDVPHAVPEVDEDLLETGQDRLGMARAGCKHKTPEPEWGER